MASFLQITKKEYIDILKNRGKTVSPSISKDKFLKRVNYLRKKDLKHLLTIRNTDINDDDSIENIINTLFKDIHKKKQAKLTDEICRYHHKQKLNNLKQDIYIYIYICRNMQKRQSQSIANELKLSNLIKQENILQEDLEEMKRFKSLSRNTLI